MAMEVGRSRAVEGERGPPVACARASRQLSSTSKLAAIFVVDDRQEPPSSVAVQAVRQRRAGWKRLPITVVNGSALVAGTNSP